MGLKLKTPYSIRIGFSHIYLLLLVGSIFLTPTFFRTTFFGNYFQANYFWIVGCLILIVKNSKFERIDNINSMIYFILLNISFFVSKGFTDYGNLLGRYITIVFPSIVLVFSYKYNDILNNFSFLAIKLFNSLVYIIVIMGVIDKFLGMKISIIMSQIFPIESFGAQANLGRYISWFGHPLVATTIFLIFLVINTVAIEEKYSNSVSRMKYYIFSGLGIILVQSKTGILCFLFLIILTNINHGNKKYIFLLFTILLASILTGLLDSIIERFITSVYSGDISTGRNSALAEVINTKELSFNFFRGHAPKVMSRTLTVALEYPILRMAYLQGILFTLVWIMFVMLSPLFYFFKKKKYRLAMCFFIILIQMNTYPSLAGISDANILLVTTVFLINILISKEDEIIE